MARTFFKVSGVFRPVAGKLAVAGAVGNSAVAGKLAVVASKANHFEPHSPVFAPGDRQYKAVSH